LRLAVVSPFVDRCHGTERALAEVLERLARVHGCEVHLFAQNVEDLDIVPGGTVPSGQVPRIHWHKVPSIPGPHLLKFLFWFYLNRFSRWRCTAFRRLSFDLVLSPGINCSDADVILVHVLFHRLRELHAESVNDPSSSRGGFRDLHRRAYYAALTCLERRIYTDSKANLAAVSQRTADMLSKYFQRDDVCVIPNGVDTTQFSPPARRSRRADSRSRRKFDKSDLVLLLIGNDWKTKGLPTVIQTVAFLRDLPVHLMIVGNDASEPFHKLARQLGVFDRCHWETPSVDVLDFYAAADIYVSPSHEDSYGLPVAEAMACGLPVITSVAAGISASIQHGKDGYILSNPDDVPLLSQWLRGLCTDAHLRDRIGAAAADTAQNWTWDQNAEAVWKLLQAAARK